MSINLNMVAVSGSIFFWLGIVLGLAGLAFLAAVGTGISLGSPSSPEHEGVIVFHHTDYLLLDWGRRWIYVLPVLAGLLLAGSGILIRRQAAEMEGERGRVLEPLASLRETGGEEEG